MSYCPYNHKIECVAGFGCEGCIHEAKPLNPNIIFEVSPDLDETICDHGCVAITEGTKIIPLSRSSLSPTVVALTKQLQVDGSYRKLGICPKCGRIYVASNITLNIKLKEEQ